MTWDFDGQFERSFQENERFEKQISDITTEIEERNKQYLNQQNIHDSLSAEG